MVLEYIDILALHQQSNAHRHSHELADIQTQCFDTSLDNSHCGLPTLYMTNVSRRLPLVGAGGIPRARPMHL